MMEALTARGSRDAAANFESVNADSEIAVLESVNTDDENVISESVNTDRRMRFL